MAYNNYGNRRPLAGHYTNGGKGPIFGDTRLGNPNSHPGQPMGQDVVPAWLRPGEFVLTPESVDMVGLNNLQALEDASPNSRTSSMERYPHNYTNVPAPMSEIPNPRSTPVQKKKTVKVDRYGNRTEEEITYDTKAEAIESTDGILRGMGLSSGHMDNALWDTYNDWNRTPSVPAQDIPPPQMNYGGTVYAQTGGWLSGLGNLIGGSLGASIGGDDEENLRRQRELEAQSQRFANLDAARSQGDAFGGNPVIPNYTGGYA